LVGGRGGPPDSISGCRLTHTTPTLKTIDPKKIAGTSSDYLYRNTDTAIAHTEALMSGRSFTASNGTTVMEALLCDYSTVNMLNDAGTIRWNKAMDRVQTVIEEGDGAELISRRVLSEYRSPHMLARAQPFLRRNRRSTVSHRAAGERQRPLSPSGPPRQLGRPIPLSTATVKTAASRTIRRRKAERVLKNINAGHLACAALGGCDSSEVESVASAMGVTITGFNDEAEEAEGNDPTFNVEPGWSSIPGWMSHQPGCERWPRPAICKQYPPGSGPNRSNWPATSNRADQVHLVPVFSHYDHLQCTQRQIRRNIGLPKLYNGRRWKWLKPGKRYGESLTNGLSGSFHVFYEELSCYSNAHRRRVYGGDDPTRSETGMSFADVIAEKKGILNDIADILNSGQPLPTVRLGSRNDDPKPYDWEKMWTAAADSIQRAGDVRTIRRKERRRLEHEVKLAFTGRPATKKRKARSPDLELHARLNHELTNWNGNVEGSSSEEDEEPPAAARGNADRKRKGRSNASHRADASGPDLSPPSGSNNNNNNNNTTDDIGNTDHTEPKMTSWNSGTQCTSRRMGGGNGHNDASGFSCGGHGCFGRCPACSTTPGSPLHDDWGRVWGGGSFCEAWGGKEQHLTQDPDSGLEIVVVPWPMSTVESATSTVPPIAATSAATSDNSDEAWDAGRRQLTAVDWPRETGGRTSVHASSVGVQPGGSRLPIWTSNPVSQEQVAAECRVESPRPAQASDNRTLQPARPPTTRSATSEAVQLHRETTGEGLQSSEVDIEETRSSSSSGGNSSSSSDDDDTLNIIRERLRESRDEEDNSDGSSSSNRGNRASSTRSAESPGLQSTNHQQGGNASATSSVAQHDGNEIQASDQHLREHYEGDHLVGGSRRSAERGVPTNTSRVNVGGDRQGDETLPIALEFDPGVTSDTSQRL
jgi:hypothetical protein